MSSLFRLFLDICLFRKTPQDVPYSGFLFVSLLTINTVLGIVSIMVMFEETKTPGLLDTIIYVAIRTTVLLVVVYFIMYLLGFKKRILQTMTTLQGADLILGLAYIIIGMSLTVIPAKSFLFLFIVMLFLGWGLAIHSNIFRHALSTSLFTAGFLAVGLFFLEILLEKQLSPISM